MAVQAFKPVIERQGDQPSRQPTRRTKLAHRFVKRNHLLAPGEPFGLPGELVRMYGQRRHPIGIDGVIAEDGHVELLKGTIRPARLEYASLSRISALSGIEA
jgi:hypothetical protein